MESSKEVIQAEEEDIKHTHTHTQTLKWAELDDFVVNV